MRDSRGEETHQHPKYPRLGVECLEVTIHQGLVTVDCGAIKVAGQTNHGVQAWRRYRRGCLDPFDKRGIVPTIRVCSSATRIHFIKPRALGLMSADCRKRNGQKQLYLVAKMNGKRDIGPSSHLMIARAAGTSVTMIDQFYTKRLTAMMIDGRRSIAEIVDHTASRRSAVTSASFRRLGCYDLVVFDGSRGWL